MKIVKKDSYESNPHYRTNQEFNDTNLLSMSNKYTFLNMYHIYRHLSSIYIIKINIFLIR